MNVLKNCIMSSALVPRNGMASAHLEKESVAANRKRCPLEDGGSMGPIMSVPHISKSQDADVTRLDAGG